MELAMLHRLFIDFIHVLKSFESSPECCSHLEKVFLLLGAAKNFIMYWGGLRLL